VEGDLRLAVIVRVLILADVEEIDASHGTSLLVSSGPFFRALNHWSSSRR
jgi:hypothetical protein